MKYYFFYKQNNTKDRDCVAYIELSDLENKHTCIDGNFNIHGACYSQSFIAEVPYAEITTILNEAEYNILAKWSEHQSMDLQPIIKKLKSRKNAFLFALIQEKESEYLQDEYGLSGEDVQNIFDAYGLDYRDRGIVACVYKDAEDCGYEEAECLDIDRNSAIGQYFDYKAFGQDLVNNDENYFELQDGRIARLNY